MNCTWTARGRCTAHFVSTKPRWTDADTARARAAGWFVWDEAGPVHFHGVALCPAHRDPQLEEVFEAQIAMEYRDELICGCPPQPGVRTWGYSDGVRLVVYWLDECVTCGATWCLHDLFYGVPDGHPAVYP